MSWDEAFAKHYEEWSAHMTADIPFYVQLARAAAGPLVEQSTGRLQRRRFRPCRGRAVALP